jgi:two-component system, chemotaxis family, protein-glutamate methylesterase/glutaminase
MTTDVRTQPTAHGREAAAPAPVVAIAASAGGPGALARVLPMLGRLDAAVLVVQHIQAEFLDGFVAWMRRESALPLEVAADGMPIEAATVYVAPPGVHLKLARGRRLLLDPEPATTHRPSADELFRSVARHAGRRAVGVVLTGMGEDGARGLLSIREGGGSTIAQDRGSSLVYGMPAAALKLDACQRVVALDDIAAAVRRAVAKARR